MTSLVKPHGRQLVERVLTQRDAGELRRRAPRLPSIALDAHELADLELVATGAASPLRGFMDLRDYRSVLDRQRLWSGVLFPVPVTLAVPVGRLGELRPGAEAALRDPAGQLRGALRITDAYVRNVREEARLLYGTDDPSHPGVAYLLSRPPGVVGGEIVAVRPRDPAFETAREVRLRLAQHGFLRVAASLGAGIPETAAAAQGAADALLVRSLAGEATLDPRFPVAVARVPLADRHLGARGALLEAIAAKNLGASHLVLGAARADLATADALLRHRDELGLTLLRELAPVPDPARHGLRAVA